MKYNNVLCIYPYKTEIREFPFCPPLGLEYIAAAMQDLVASFIASPKFLNPYKS